jgi:hypothetical protein
MGSILPYFLGAAFLSLGFLALVLGLRSLGGNEMTRRLNDFVGSETVQAPARVQTLTCAATNLPGIFPGAPAWFKAGQSLGRFRAAWSSWNINWLSPEIRSGWGVSSMVFGCY